MIQNTPPELLRLACRTCGGSFALRDIARVLVCPYCRSAQQVPEQQLAALSAYDARASAAIDSADQAVALAQRADAVNRAGALMGWFAGIAVLVTVVGMIAAFVVHAMNAPSATPESQSSFLLLYAAYGGLIVLLGVFAAISSRSQPYAVRGGRFSADCPHCGATEQLLVGQTHHTCGHCRVNLVPSGAAIAAGLSVASVQQRDASLQQLRASRRMYAAIGTRARRLAIFSKAWMILLPFGASLAFAYQASRGTVEPEAAPAWGAAALVVAVVIGVQSSRVRRRNQRWGVALEGLARVYPATALTDSLHDIINWLDAYWPEAYGQGYDVRNIGSPALQAAMLNVHGFPVLLTVCSPAKASQGFVDCLVAAVPKGVRVTVNGTQFVSWVNGHAQQTALQQMLEHSISRALTEGASPAPRL